ncbi:hypothetical protein B9Z55_010136 [Caenorhabditis nigoni]|nr:hypothetical protein B9Z55_010136 [Caenorhabditis nigoni]
MNDKDVNLTDGEKPRSEESGSFPSVFYIIILAMVFIWIVLFILVCGVMYMNKRKRRNMERQQYAAMRGWKGGQFNSRSSRMITTSNPNVIYGQTPRITPYESY